MRDKKSFLILSGGVGSRSRHFEPKQFYKINGIEMIAYSLRIANEHPGDRGDRYQCAGGVRGTHPGALRQICAG